MTKMYNSEGGLLFVDDSFVPVFENAGYKRVTENAAKVTEPHEIDKTVSKSKRNKNSNKSV